MTHFTGRKPTGLGARIGKGLLDGLEAVGTAMNDGPKLERIKQIDSEMERLQHEKDSLIVGLIEPGNLKVSDDYDPHKAVIMNVAGARLTHCEGRRTSSRYHDAHPACPYIETIHNAHDFTARD